MSTYCLQTIISDIIAHFFWEYVGYMGIQYFTESSDFHLFQFPISPTSSQGGTVSNPLPTVHDLPFTKCAGL